MSDRISEIRESIKKHQREKQVTLVGATKAQPVETVQKVIEAGLLDLGVNYVQEGEELRAALSNEKVIWHFIGHIQSRKVKYLPQYDMVQSLERMEIALALEKQLEAKQKKIKALIEINIGKEPGKSGILAEDLPAFLTSLQKLKHIQTVGLMVMPPPEEDLEKRRPFFKQARDLYDQYQSKFGFDTLSMGTSEDYLVAVEEGSNMVRLGTTLFGARKRRE